MTDVAKAKALGTSVDRSTCVSPRNPVRVAFVIDRLGLGGTETQLLALIRCLDPSRIEPYLILLDGTDSDSLELLPVQCPTLCLGVHHLLSWKSLVSLRRLGRYLQNHGIEIVQTYFPDSTYFGVAAAHVAGIRAIIRTRNNDNYWMTSGHRYLGRILNRLVSLTVCNSAAARDAVLRDEQCDPARVAVIENGVDLERFNHVPTVRRRVQADSVCRVGMVANLRRVKGIDVFIEAAAMTAEAFPSTEFVVAGEGDFRGDLEQLIGRLKLRDRFRLLGSIQDIPAFLGTLDIAVLSSHTEGMPNAVMEYMAAARPIIVTNVAGIKSLIHHESNGLIANCGDKVSLSECLNRLILDPVLAVQLAKAARRDVEAHYGRPIMVERFSETFEKLCCDKSAGRQGFSAPDPEPAIMRTCNGHKLSLDPSARGQLDNVKPAHQQLSTVLPVIAQPTGSALRRIVEHCRHRILYRFASIPIIRSRLNRSVRQSVAVLMYHGVTRVPLPSPLWCQLGEDKFAEQIEQLVDARYRVLPLSEVLQRIEHDQPLPDFTACVTFDDGFLNVSTTAFEILKSRSLPATIFLVTDLIGSNQPPWPDQLYHLFHTTDAPTVYFEKLEYRLTTPNLRAMAHRGIVEKLKKVSNDDRLCQMERLTADLGSYRIPRDSQLATLNWDDIQILRSSGLVDFGAHTASHPILSRCSLDVQAAEIRNSRNVLLERLGEAVLFAYPNGTRCDFTLDTCSLVRQLGFHGAVTTEAGLHPIAADPYTMRRIPMGAEVGGATFERALLGI